ncbi:MAG TPA: hypothetical protein VFB62_25710 [Polyangiaceae bacterium]|jgi:hypothetical protein|nr:hypothetical protein [Polyangiaceae bacterium]
MARLARVTDPRTLDVQDGSRASLSVNVPAQWFEEGASIELTVPKRLTCARCDGGGCDSCDRSGALRAPADEDQRRVIVNLPPQSSANLRIRIVDPFEGGIAQLLIDVRAGELAPCVKRIEAAPHLRPRWAWIVAALVLAILLVIAALAS